MASPCGERRQWLSPVPAPGSCPLPGGGTHLLKGDGLLAALPQLAQHLGVLPQVGLAAHQQDRDALAEVVHLRVPLWGTGGCHQACVGGTGRAAGRGVGQMDGGTDGGVGGNPLGEDARGGSSPRRCVTFIRMLS